GVYNAAFSIIRHKHMQELFYFTGIEQTVATALAEDIGSGDITAQPVPPRREASAGVLCRDAAGIGGRRWVDETGRQVDPRCVIAWAGDDGEQVEPDSEVLPMRGGVRSLVPAERTAVNFLQTLSGVAISARRYADLVAHTQTKILD